MQFIHQPLTWGFLLALLPLLIHLINLMRQRRVEWAAMEFLLEAYKKRRNWIWLKQVLLLLARMMAIAAVVAMLAKLVTSEQWSSFLGGKTTHHYVLLDDSLSMGERLGGGTAFDRAIKATGQLINRIAKDGATGGARFTLLRYSRAIEPEAAEVKLVDTTNPETGIAAQSDKPTPPAPPNQGADFNAVVVDVDLDARWAERQRDLNVSELAVGPASALELIAQRIDERNDEQPIIYVLSDFRHDPWDAPREIAAELSSLEDAGAAIRLVRCAETDQTNLAITDIRAVEGIHAASVPLYIEIAVHNYGAVPVEQVPVSLTTIYYPGQGATTPQESKGSYETLPDILFDNIPPGQTVTRRTQVFFPTAGQHAVQAELPADALAGDNRRWCVVDLPSSLPVLAIDQDPQRRNAEFLASVFQPSERVETGIRVIVESPAYLRDVIPEELAKYAAIYLLDCESLDAKAIENVQRYTREGGGVGLFLGPLSKPRFYRDWYQDGEGLFPVPVQTLDLLEPSSDGAPDLLVEDHPLFRMLLGQRNAFLNRILIHQYHKTRFGWQPPEQSGIRVIARLRNGQPLVAERPYGRGRVVASLTTLAPLQWNTWATEPTFVVFLLELQAYLQRPSGAATTGTLVGAPLELIWDAEQFQREVIFAFSAEPDERTLASRSVEPADGRLRWGSLSSDSSATDRSGLYEAWLAGFDGVYSVQRHAVNVDPSESDLTICPPEKLAENLPTEQLLLLSAADMMDSAATTQSFSLAQAILIGLLVLLVLEQLLSYSASYHPTRIPARGAVR